MLNVYENYYIKLIPVISNRAPKSDDNQYMIGRLWIYPEYDAVYILTSIKDKSAKWNMLKYE